MRDPVHPLAGTASDERSAVPRARRGRVSSRAGSRRSGGRSGGRVVGLLVVASVTSAAACASDDDAEPDDADGAPAAAPETALDAEVRDTQAAPASTDEDDSGRLAAALDEVATLTDEVSALEDDTASLTDELALVRVQLEATTQRADAAEARVAAVEEIVGRFPIALDSSLIPDDMPGRYEITFQEAYCEGFPGCGTPPGPTTAELYFTEERFLRIGVDGILDAGLFALDGSLYGITDSLTALPTCGDQPRRARVTVTMYADSISVLEDGTRVVNDVNASITIDAPEAGPECPAGLAFYATSLLPVS